MFNIITFNLIVLLHQWYWSYEYSDFLTDSGESIDFDVRGERPFCQGSSRSVHFYYVDATTHLTYGESSWVNIACELKANYNQNQLVVDISQVASPTIKAILLEPNHQETSIYRYCHYWDGTFSKSSALNQRGDEVDFATQAMRIGANDESLVSKGDV